MLSSTEKKKAVLQITHSGSCVIHVRPEGVYVFGTKHNVNFLIVRLFLTGVYRIC